MTKFLALFDTHYGFERRNGKVRTIHDQRAINSALSFAQDFKPDHLILGGDILDCGAISHHNKGKPGATEGFKLINDAEICQSQFIDPLSKVMGNKPVSYILGNHEDWLVDHAQAIPGLEGLLNVDRLLKLPKEWKILPQGSVTRIGKLWFAHGDQIKGGEAVAKAAALYFNRNIRFGHFHTYQAFTTTSAIDSVQPKTGIAVPCLSRKDPAYNEGKPNRWCQGFCYGYIEDNGDFSDYTPIIVNGKVVIHGKIYRG